MATGAPARATSSSMGARLSVALIIAASWLVVVTRAIPVRDGDRGVFASVAERLAAGDRLYVDVWDNKDPLFYLTLGAGRLFSPYADVAIELAWLVAAALAVFAIVRSNEVPLLTAALVGMGMTPLILTGAYYYAGFTHLPATALFLAGYAFVLRRWFVAAGALAVVLAAFKLIMLPLSLAVIITYIVVTKDRRATPRTLLGASLALVALALLLAARGELSGFLSTVRVNITYSQAGVSDAYQVPIWQHLEPVFQGPAVATTACIVLILAITRSLFPKGSRLLWWSTVTSLAAAVVVVALTGLWPHHGQVLFGPAALALALLVCALPTLHRVAVPSAFAILAATVLLSGAPGLRSMVDAGLSAPTRWRDLARISPPSVDLLALAKPGDYYARLGKNTEDTHAQGLRALRLACPKFHQYSYDPQATLAAIPPCLPLAQFVLVDKAFTPEPGNEVWNAFVRSAKAELARDFSCTTRDWGQLCVNDTATP